MKNVIELIQFDSNLIRSYEEEEMTLTEEVEKRKYLQRQEGEIYIYVYIKAFICRRLNK